MLALLPRQSFVNSNLDALTCYHNMVLLYGSHVFPVSVTRLVRQDILWQFIERKALYLHLSGIDEQQRIWELMRQYQNVPMDLADASLVSAAEMLNISRIFSLESDFYIYRFQGTKAFEVIP